MAACVGPLFAQPGNPFPRPTPCTPRAALHGRDTLLAYLPCNDLARLQPAFRPVADCALARMKAGGWPVVVFETYRSDERQRFLYSYGRTRPGPRVTNARTARMGAHFSGDALDVIHRTKGWEHPRFFYWWGQHLEACGAVAGVFWKSFPDGPHGQSTTWRKPGV